MNFLLILFYVLLEVPSISFGIDVQETYYWATILKNDQQTIQMNGFVAENHTVQTPDGYVLRIFRVVNPNRQTNRGGYPIVLFAGLQQDSQAFMSTTDGWFNRSTGIYSEFENQFSNRLDIYCPPLQLPQRYGRNIPFTLAACGFDVWLANVRDDSNHAWHLSLNRTDPAYWNITLDDYTTDVGSILDHVINVSNSRTIGVLCYSISCTCVQQLMIEQRRFNDLIRPLFHLAPFIFNHHMISLPLLTYVTLEPFLRNILRSTPDFTPILPYVANTLKSNGILRAFYVLGLYALSGLNPDEFMPERLYRVAAHFPSTAAIRILAHIGQRYLTDRFYKYDFGPDQNRAIYGSQKPPFYDIGTVSNRNMVLFHGTQDFICDMQDIQILQQQLNVPFMEIHQANYGHLDFVFARSLNNTVVRPIIQVLDRLNLNQN